MGLETKTVDDLVRIAAAGGGFRLPASRRPTDELVRIAAAASKTGAPITFADLGGRTTDDLVRIAAAGKGCIVLED